MEKTTISKFNIPQFRDKNNDAIEFFLNYGFHIEQNIFSDDDCNQAIEMSKFLPNYLNKSYIPEQMPQLHHQYYSDMMKNTKLTDITKKLISKNKEIFGLQSTFFYKPPGFTGASKHQDRFYVEPSDISGFLSAWVSLVDFDLNNMGNLVVYAKSHKKGNLKVNKIENNKKIKFQINSLVNHEQIYEQYDNREKIIIFAKKGSVVFLHPNAVHESVDNNSQKNGYSILFTYIRDDCSYKQGRVNRQKIKLY